MRVVRDISEIYVFPDWIDGVAVIAVIGLASCRYFHFPAIWDGSDPIALRPPIEYAPIFIRHALRTCAASRDESERRPLLL